MKKLFLVLPIIAFIFILTGCLRETYTVEKFMGAGREKEGEYIEVNNIEEHIQDYDGQIKNKLLDNVEYKKCGKFKKTENYFKWYKYISPSTSGPNEIALYFYEDGYVLINRRYALGPNSIFYYKLDQDKAKEIYSFVKEEVEECINSKKEAFELAKQEAGDVDDFLVNLDNKKNLCYYQTITQTSPAIYFSENEELCNILLNITFEFIDEKEYSTHYNYNYDLLITNKLESTNFENNLWYMTITKYGDVDVIFEFSDAKGRDYTLIYSYSITSADVNDIFDNV